MRVHLFADSPWEDWPSMDRYARSLFNALKQVAPEVDFRLLVPPDPPPGFRGRLLISWRMVIYLLWARRYPADLYHVLDHSYGHLLFVLDGSRTVVTVHDVSPMLFPARRWGLSRLAWKISWKGAQKASWWIAVSDFTKRELVVRTGQNAERISPIHNGVEPHFRPLSMSERAEWREKWSPGSHKFILHVGHCQPRKNLEGLLAALALLARQELDFLFVQVGGVFTSSQQHLIEGLGLEKRVCQISRVSENELVGLYNAADTFILPSLYEGFGLPALEAMACGTPVIASNAASLPEVVGDAGLLVDPRNSQAIADAIARVLSETALAEELRQRGLERVRMFNWEKTARETVAIYRKVLDETG